jgi:molybdate transport system permease protein
VTARRGRLVPAALGVVGTTTLVLLIGLPLLALILRAPWGEVLDILGDPAVRDALRLSITVSLWALVLAVALGFPIAWVLARVPFPGRSLVRSLVLLPMVVPPVIGGVALLVAFGRRGVVGQYLYEWFDIRLGYTLTAAVIAATFVSLPFFVITVEAALQGVDRRYEDAARSLGASPTFVLRHVTVPSIRGALGAGAALAWARALGEFGATITFAGSFEGRTQTMPLAIYDFLDTDVHAAILLSLVLLAVSVAVLALLRGRWLGTS